MITWIDAIENGIEDNMSKLSSFKPLLSDKLPYYISSYECPLCNDFLLYKMRVRGRKAFYKKTLELYNLFTCPKCRVFYASIVSSETNTPITLNNFALLSDEISIKDYINFLFDLKKYENE